MFLECSYCVIIDKRSISAFNFCDLLKDPNRVQDALLTIERGLVTFAGPLTLIQNNKTAIIARYPVFTDFVDPMTAR